MQEHIRGYKIFDKNFQTISGNVFECKKTYTYNGKIQIKQKGFHFALQLEDTLRYSDALNEEVIITEVTALGKTIEFSDEYYGYYDLYVTDKISIDKVLTREEIIDYAISLPDERLIRFVSGIKLNPKEIRLFLNRSKKVLQAIDYYQFGNKAAYSEGTFLTEWKKVKRYGKYNYKRCKRK